MVINDFEFWHQDRQVNPRHLESILDFHRTGIKSSPGYQPAFGVEIEHLTVRTKDNSLSAPAGQAVTYGEKHGMKDVLHDLRPLFDPDREFWDKESLLGLGRPGGTLSLEPGGQLEFSLDPVHTSQELADLYRIFRADVDPVLSRHGIRLITYVYQPVSKARDIEIIPERRYDCMNRFFGRISSFGWNMMRASASTQISIDYVSQADAVTKMRVATAVDPILGFFFRNSPYFEGKKNPYPLLRQHLWGQLDQNRTGITPGLYDDDFGFEQAAYNVLASPLMVADLTHTPDADCPHDSQVFMASFANAADIYPDRPLNKYEITHIISTHFNDVRLKNFLELRHWDSLPIGRVAHLVDLAQGLFYNPSKLADCSRYFSGLSRLDVEEAKLNMQVYGKRSHPYDRPLDFWWEFLGCNQVMGPYDPDSPLPSATCAIPGDSLHPDIFQE